MFIFNIKFLIAILLALNTFLSGCQALQTDKTFDILNGMAASTQKQLADGSAGQFSVSGQGINPGLKTEAAVTYSVKVGYDGLAGQFSASGAGTIKQLTPAQEAEIGAILRETAISTEQRQARILAVISK